MSDETRQILLAGAGPAATAALAAAGLWLLRRRSADPAAGWAAGAWIVPGIGAVWALAAWYVLLRDSSGRWQWLVPALVGLSLAWAAGLMPRPTRPTARRLTTLGVALGLALFAGGCAAMTLYSAQSPAYYAVVPVAVFLLALALHPLAATELSASDALAVAVAGVAACGVIVLGQFIGGAILLAPACVAAGVVAVSSLFYRGGSHQPARAGLLAGALAAAVLMPVAALVCWLNSYDLGAPLAWALALPASGLPLLWLARLPVAKRRPRVAGVVVFLLAITPAVVGVALAASHTDLRAFGITAGDAPAADDYGW